MEVFFGFFWNRERLMGDRKLIQELGTQFHDTYLFSHNRFSIGIAFLNSSKPRIIETDQYFFFASGRFDNSGFSQLFSLDDSSIDVLFSTDFDSFIESIRGDFIFILYDKNKQKLICARDHLGMKPFYYVKDQRFISFSNEIGLFRGIPEFSFQITDQWIADSLSLIRSEKDISPFDSIYRLIPGSLLIIDNNLEIQPYWQLQSSEDYSNIDFETAKKKFCQKFDEAVRRRIIGCNVVGTELSGGLDSSGVTAYVHKNQSYDKNKLYAFSHVFSEKGHNEAHLVKDELAYSKALVCSISNTDHILCAGINKGILQTIKESIINNSAPSQASYHLFSDVLLERAEQFGVTKLFSGFGGDEGVSSSANEFFLELILQRERSKYRKEYMKYMMHKGYGKIYAALLCEGYYVFRPYLDLFLGSKTHRKQRTVISALDISDKQFSDQMRIKDRFIKKYIFPDKENVRENHIRQILRNSISDRLESSYLTARSYGIEYLYPLLDIDLLQFYLDLPSEYKYRDGIGRAIYRESLKGFVPDKIRNRNDKSGRTIPVAFNRIANDYDEITKLVQRSKAENRFHYVDYEVLLNRLDIIRDHSLGKKVDKGKIPGFISAIQIILLQDMQRNGEFNSGIRH